MNELTALLAHNTAVITGDRFAASVLLVVLISFVMQREKRKSTVLLGACCLNEMLCLIADSMGFSYDVYGNLSTEGALAAYFVAYFLPGITTLLFACYVKAYIEEKTAVNRWLFRVPIVLMAVMSAILLPALLSGSVFGVVDGTVTVVGDTPLICRLLQLIVVVYLPVAAWMKRRAIGAKAVCLLGSFGLVPVIVMFIDFDCSMMVVSPALLIVYVLLQNDISEEKERHRIELEEVNGQLRENQARLEEASAEQEAQIEEIGALNNELEERQTQLEESAAEQESQIEEITALNAELEERQAQLEEVSAEQESQIEEINALNRELREQKEQAAEAYGMIEGLSQEYHTLWLIEAETRRIHLVRSSGVGTIRNAVQMGQDNPDYDTVSRQYIDTYVMPEDRERMRLAISFAEILNRLEQSSLYAVNYLRRTDEGITGYHQIAFANADTADGRKQFVCGFRDVDGLVRTEETQKQELQQQLDLVNTLSRDYLNVYVIEPERNVVRILKLDGYVTAGLSADKPEYPYDAACRQYIADRVYPEDSEMMTEVMSLANIREQLESGSEYAGTYRVLDGGEIHYYQYIYAKITGTENIIAGFRNVDQMIAAERQQQLRLENALKAAEAANNAKTAFLFSMSHDIRTPMNAILGYAGLLEKSLDDREKTEDYIRKIRNSGDFLLSLINNVLEMARIESGKVTPDEDIISVADFSDEVRSVYDGLMREKNIHYTQSRDVRTQYVFADKVKLNEIFLNLISNAYKYTPGGGSVSLETKEIPCEREGWTILQTTVSDTGIGMSKDYLPRLFEEFSRERNATDAGIRGTGLGMPIVKKLVDLMGGTITVESELGKGTTIVVSIPHRIAPAPEEYSEQAGEIDTAALAGRRILLAEDNDLNAEIAMELLADAGLLVDRAEDGIICVDMLVKAAPGTYDLILMDIQMPNMDGYKAAEKIRRLADKRKADIPILAMTANAFEEDKQDALAAGMNGHLAKPIDVPVLLKTLEEILR